MRNPPFNQSYKLCTAVAVLMLATGFARPSAGADGPAAPATQPATPPAPGARGGARGGPTVTIPPLATAVAVELTPPLDKDGNFKVSSKGGWNTVRRITVPADVPKGEVINFQLQSSDSKFYPRSVATRQIWVYIPAGYKEGDVLPLMVDHDGGANSVVQTQMIAAMDLLIHDKKIPMMAGLFVANGGNARSQEYDTPSGKFAEFLEAEVIPAAEKAAKIKVTKNPDARGTIGQSSGGAAALAMAWYHNDLYHRVISYSGSFTQLQRTADAPRGAWEFHQTLIPNSAKKPLRIWMEVGSNDLNNNFGDWRVANNDLAEVLKAKGYDYQYLWAEGAGHVEGGVERQTMLEAMEWVWKGYKAK